MVTGFILTKKMIPKHALLVYILNFALIFVKSLDIETQKETLKTLELEL